MTKTGRLGGSYGWTGSDAWRTGAVGGVGIRQLSESCRTVGGCRAGVQGFLSALCACAARPIYSVCNIITAPVQICTEYLTRLEKLLMITSCKSSINVRR